MIVYRLRSLDQFTVYSKRNAGRLQRHQDFLTEITPSSKTSFTVPGYSYTAGKSVNFIVDYQHSCAGGRINWRESVICPLTYFNNRMRYVIHLFDIEMEFYPDNYLYISEQVTPIYKYFKKKYPSTTGSEFLGDKIPFGDCDKFGIRNETLCSLTFPDQHFDALVCLDVFEHIPDYELAFSECARVLKTGGKMMWSVPFLPLSYSNLVRARIADSRIIHILAPEYHGDPLSSKGALCFQHFGWQVIDQVRHAGFRDAYALCFHSERFGYLGGDQFIFVAIK